MNSKLLLLPSIVISSVLGVTRLDPAIPIPITIISLKCDAIGPFDYKASDYNLTGKLTVRRKYNNIRERISVGQRGSSYTYFQTTAAHSMSLGDTVDITFKLPLSSMLGNEGIMAKIEVLNSSNSAILTYEFNLKPAIEHSIDPKNYLTSDYVLEDVVINPTNYENQKAEIMRFDGFTDYFDVDNYYRIDLNDLSMTYSCFKDFPGGNAVLHFDDYDNVFPYLHTSDEGINVDVPVVIYEKEGRICFKFRENMYVNPKTLEMSLDPGSDFQATKYFYLPINKSRELLDRVFVLKCANFGYGKTKFDWNIRYTNNRNLIGECSNSDFCVIGEVN